MSDISKRLDLHCPNCGIKCIDNSLYCHRCGVRLIPILACNNCEQICNNGDNYCRFCGASIASETKNESPTDVFKDIWTFLEKLRKNWTTLLFALIVANFIYSMVVGHSIIPNDMKQLRSLFNTGTVSVSTIKNFILFTLFLSISIYNYKIPIIPDIIVLPGIIVGVIISGVDGGLSSVLDSFLGIIVSGAAFLIPAFFLKLPSKGKESRIGGGTIKCAAMIGSFVGFKLSIIIMMFAFALLLPKFIIDMRIREREFLVNTSPYLFVCTLLVLILYGK